MRRGPALACRTFGITGIFLVAFAGAARAQFPIHFGAMQAGCNQYETMMRAQNPTVLWRVLEGSGATLQDAMGASNGTTVNNPGRNAAGPLLTSPSAALALNGSSQYAYSSAGSPNPTVLTLGTWFKTSTGSGGRLAGLSSSQTGNSTNRDRHIYMRNTGQLLFGIGANLTIQSPKSYNDNAWHFAVATLSGAGMRLYVDGVLVASSASTAATNYTGYFRIGHDNLSGWASAPSSNYFNGQLAEPFVAIGAAWTEARIADLYEMGRYCRTFSAPTVASISPRQGVGAGGGTVTVTGTGFMAPMEIWIAGRECTSLNIVDDTTATCTVPANPSGNAVIERASVSAVVGARATTVADMYGYVGAPIFWLDSTAPNSMFTNTGCTTAAGNGAAVACWKDLSGNNVNFTQSTAGSRPTYVAGTGIDLDGSADYLSGTLPSMSNTNAVSFVGWVNMDATSTQYVGFIFTRTGLNATGLNATTSAAQVGYHWNDTSASYSWSSGLTYTAGAWTFLGLAVSSTTAVGYRNAGSATNTTSHTSLAIGGKTFDLGRDSNGSRYLDGKIEKAGMWSQTLNATQIGVIRDTR